MRPQIAGGTLERRSKTRSACVVRRYTACFRIISVAQCRESWKCVSLGRIDCDLLCRLRVPSNMLPVSGRGSTRPCATAQRHAGRLVEALDAPHQSPGWSYITLFQIKCSMLCSYCIRCRIVLMRDDHKCRRCLFLQTTKKFLADNYWDHKVSI